jgi:hypothetical protein
MRNEDLFKRFLAIFDELERIDKEHSIESSEEVNPQVSQLTLEGKRIISELDPVIRVIYRASPDTLAEWQELFEIFDSIEENNLNGGLTGKAPGSQDEASDPQAQEIMEQGEGDHLVSDKLDPIAREGLRDHLEELAEWDRHMEAYYGLGKTEPDKSDS